MLFNFGFSCEKSNNMSIWSVNFGFSHENRIRRFKMNEANICVVPFCMHDHRWPVTNSNRHLHGHPLLHVRRPCESVPILLYPLVCDRMTCPSLYHLGKPHNVNRQHSPHTVHCLSTMQQPLYSPKMNPVLQINTHANSHNQIYESYRNDRPTS